MLFFAKRLLGIGLILRSLPICSLCTALCSHPVLALPDFTKPFHIESDASNTAVGGVLTQEHASIHKPIAFPKQYLTSSEQNYSVCDYELLVIIICCKAWRPYIDGQWIIVLTVTNLSFTSTINFYSNKMQIRWLKTLADTPIQIICRPCVAALVPDTLSWRPSMDTLLQHPLSCCLTHCNPGYHFGGRIFSSALLCSLVWPLWLWNMQIYPIGHRYADPYFCIIHKFSVALLARQVNPDAPL